MSHPSHRDHEKPHAPFVNQYCHLQTRPDGIFALGNPWGHSGVTLQEPTNTHPKPRVTIHQIHYLTESRKMIRHPKTKVGARNRRQYSPLLPETCSSSLITQSGFKRRETVFFSPFIYEPLIIYFPSKGDECTGARPMVWQPPTMGLCAHKQGATQRDWATAPQDLLWLATRRLANLRPLRSNLWVQPQHPQHRRQLSAIPN